MENPELKKPFWLYFDLFIYLIYIMYVKSLAHETRDEYLFVFIK